MKGGFAGLQGAHLTLPRVLAKGILQRRIGDSSSVVGNRRCGHDGDPWCFTDGLQEMASAVANDFAPMNSDDLLGAAHKNHPIEGWDEFSYGVLIGFLNLSNALLAYANAADVWKRSRPEVARPNDEGARRLYFIRKMTNYFRKQYGTPLRESVAVLTSSIYKCDMDAATVAKLAP